MPENNAIKVLATDHREVESLFEEFEATKNSAKKAKLVKQICEQLIIHAMVEEEIFYPAVSASVEADLLKEAYVEHDGAKRIIIDLLGGNPDGEFFDAKVSVLKEMIEHHVYEEERQRDSMFAQARKDDVDLDAVGDAIVARKLELTTLAKAGNLPPPQLLTAPG